MHSLGTPPGSYDIARCGAPASGLNLAPVLAHVEHADHLLAHPELLRLAGDGHGEARHEAHVVRHLEVRDAVAAVLPHVAFAELGALADAYPRAHLLPVPLVGYAEHLHLHDPRMRE